MLFGLDKQNKMWIWISDTKKSIYNSERYLVEFYVYTNSELGIK